MGTTIKFSIPKAKATKRELEDGIGEIKNAFQNLSAEIENTKDWWKGKSQKDFVVIYNQHQEEVLKEIGDWLKDYGELVIKYGNAYSNADSNMIG